MASVLYGQVLDLQPELGTNLDFSPEAVAKFNSPEAFEDKHPQLTPAKGIHDAMALKDPRPTDGFSVGSVTSITTLFPNTAGGGTDNV